jgi:hypothetical protein
MSETPNRSISAGDFIVKINPGVIAQENEQKHSARSEEIVDEERPDIVVKDG